LRIFSRLFDGLAACTRETQGPIPSSASLTADTSYDVAAAFGGELGLPEDVASAPPVGFLACNGPTHGMEMKQRGAFGIPEKLTSSFDLKKKRVCLCLSWVRFS
jgi:hypothetical protein